MDAFIKNLRVLWSITKALQDWTISFLGTLVPRSSRIWVFYGWHQGAHGEIFADNSKYLFLEAHKQSEIRAIWLAKDHKMAKKLNSEGFESYPLSSGKGVFFALRAGVTVVDAFMSRFSWRYSRGSKVVQLWHGKGMKKTGYDSPYSLQRYNRFLQPHLFVAYAFTIATSDYTAELMQNIFHIAKEQVFTTGLPRNDALHREIPGSQIDAVVLQKSNTSPKKKSFLYAPTFRPDGSNPLDQIDFSTLSQIAEQNNFEFFVSLHPKFAQKKYHTWELKNISFIPPGYDIYPVLKDFDVLITDYSSLYVDFLILNRPIIFFTYDQAQYEREMGLYADFQTLTPGPHPEKFLELLKLIQNPTDTHKQERQQVIQKLFHHQDGNATARVLKKIEETVLE